MYQIVDTNVLLVASKKAPQASEICELTCEKYLQELMNTGVLVIDSQWLIIKEYMNKNSQSGQPNAGDNFLNGFYSIIQILIVAKKLLLPKLEKMILLSFRDRNL